MTNRSSLCWLVAFALGALGAGCEAKAHSAPVPSDLAAQILAAVPSDIETRTALEFDGKLRLVGFDLAPRDRVSAGQKLTLKLYWQRVAPLAKGDADEGAPFRVTSRLFGARGRPFPPDSYSVQSRLEDGSSPLLPRDWPLGKVVVDERELTVPSPLPTPELVLAIAVEREFEYQRPVRASDTVGAGGAAPEPVADDDKEPRSRTEAATMPVRLRVIGGPSLPSGYGVLARLATDWVRPEPAVQPRRARPLAE